MSAYAVSTRLLEIAEERSLNSKMSHMPKFHAMLKEFWHPLSFLFLGFDFLIQHFVKIILYSALFVVIAASVSMVLGLSHPQQQANIIVAAVLGWFIVLFSLPSKYAHLNLPGGEVEFLEEQIRLLVKTKVVLDSVRSNLDLMEKTVDTRIKALSLALAASWALFLFIFSQSIGVAFRLDQTGQNMNQVITGSALALTVAAFFATIPLLGIAGYRIACDKTFKWLGFACSEAALKLEKQSRRTVRQVAFRERRY